MKDGQIDLGTAQSMAKRIAEAKPRGYLGILGTFQRLLRLEVDKKHAVIESATELGAGEGEGIAANLRRKYGDDLSTEFTQDGRGVRPRDERREIQHTDAVQRSHGVSLV